MSRAIEAKAYRERVKQRMGAEAYKNEQSRKRAERRARARANRPAPAATPATPAREKSVNAHKKELDAILKSLQDMQQAQTVNLPQVRILTEKAQTITHKIRAKESCKSLREATYQAKKEIAESKGQSIKRKSFDQQFTKVENLHRLYTGGDTNCSDFDWVRDTKKVHDFIKKYKPWKTPNSKNGQLQALSSILKVIDGYEEEYKYYSNASKAGRKAIDKSSEASTLTDKERKNILPWSELKNLSTKIKNPRDKALVGIYTLIPPRRVEDISLIKVKYNPRKKDKKGLDKNFNYLMVGRVTKKPTTLIFNRYKTEKTFNVQEFKVPVRLAAILRDYIIEHEHDDEDILFGTQKGGVQSGFSSVVAKTFKTYTNKAVTANLIRHSFISDFLDKPKLSLGQRKKVAEAMGHSINTQLKYSRVDIESLAEDD